MRKRYRCIYFPLGRKNIRTKHLSSFVFFIGPHIQLRIFFPFFVRNEKKEGNFFNSEYSILIPKELLYLLMGDKYNIGMESTQRKKKMVWGPVGLVCRIGTNASGPNLNALLCYLFPTSRPNNLFLYKLHLNPLIWSTCKFKL